MIHANNIPLEILKKQVAVPYKHATCATPPSLKNHKALELGIVMPLQNSRSIMYQTMEKFQALVKCKQKFMQEDQFR